ncbi:MAG: glycosyltransferase family 2 protein [Salinimicrobium sp.]
MKVLKPFSFKAVSINFLIFSKSQILKKEPLLQEEFDSYNCCVLIPTFNNATTLAGVLNKVLDFTRNVIVINDGSTDSTSKILQSYPHLDLLSFPENKGKGEALKKGFLEAESLGFSYAITMDSDGQHFPDDLPVFLDALKAKKPLDKELLVIGSRKMDAPEVPGKSSFGNRCSTFWFRVETGVQLQDTQCGYRLYPLKEVNKMKLFTSKFELEIEVLVKAAWKGIEVINLPVKVKYDPQERVTHFRPLQDVARITLLNIWFVAVGCFYIFPRNFFRKL